MSPSLPPLGAAVLIVIAVVAPLRRPSVLRCAVASASASRARPAALQGISSITPPPAELRPSTRSVAESGASLLRVMAASAAMELSLMQPGTTLRATLASSEKKAVSAVLALLAVAAWPLMLIPQVPLAPLPLALTGERA